MNAPRPIRGVLWMLVTGLLFIGVNAAVKHGAQGLPAAEAAFLRYAAGMVFIAPMLGHLRRAKLDRRDWQLFAMRGGFHTIGVTLWFFAMTRMPLVEVAAMNYLSPIYIAILATFFLGEKFVPARGMAVAAAFVGTLMILRPGFRELTDGHFAMLLAALVFAGSYMTGKMLSDRVSPVVVVVMLSLAVTIGLFPLALAVWQQPSWAELFWLSVTAALATAGHFTMTLAFREAPITVTQPVTFLQLVWATLLGAVFFGEPLDALSIAGGTVIAGAVIALALYEAHGRRRQRERTALGPD